MSKRDFLFELGTEELPPRSLFTLARSLSDGIVAGLDDASIAHGEAQWFATPRRLAVRIAGLADRQPDQEIRRHGPALTGAFDAHGQPTKAALGFAASCGVALDALGQADGPKGAVLAFVTTRKGESTRALLPDIVTAALNALPIARRMRWGAGEQEFVRPVHWAVMLLGGQVVEGEILGLRIGNRSRGHRFHAPRELTVTSPAKYLDVLREKGSVMADAAQRREHIRSEVMAIARNLGGEAVIEADLLDEVTALVEWPVPLAGRFDARYLELPPEVPIATLQAHQRYFPVRDAQGRLMNAFIAVANIRSRDPDKVRDGNERVVRPRLADAAFFWDADRRVRLEQRCEALAAVTYQAALGSLLDKSKRIAVLAVRIAESLGADAALARRAALLSKCDLLTAMVGEFPELQGVMGKYYAQHDGEAAEICTALEEQYWPRFAGDHVPATKTGQVLSIADKLDTIAGIFCIGQKPSGTRDPFGLRRASLGVLRCLLERNLDLDLQQLIEAAVGLQPVPAPDGVAQDIWAYLMERLRSSYLESHSNRAVTTELFDAVIGSDPHSPVDIDIRLRALEGFLILPQAASLASANKRIANLLRKAPENISGAVDTAYLQDAAEHRLFDHVVAMERAVNPLFARREYTEALTQLASLRDDVDRFFDAVMIMADEPEVRANRLALLVRLRDLFLQVADLSRLPG
ncbi:glycyl-tRNA synthetase beta chain [Steroidobacter denitrificans]|uniref:Glycine--tRNA ligase beta subunit n=1 Tax=Steroidobacter denitrificans TaxID=465721 RepID=A0A127FDL8_STEDE|nr:glycine--tRNA ligase subunit beta [Steroidobacter denitrificans]AMN48476.1 glycyl-tRNA synthetase beta chain [Steroidobacter denitrificans]